MWGESLELRIYELGILIAPSPTFHRIRAVELNRNPLARLAFGVMQLGPQWAVAWGSWRFGRELESVFRANSRSDRSVIQYEFIPRSNP